MNRDLEYHAQHFDIFDGDFNDPDCPYLTYAVMRKNGNLIYSDRPPSSPVEEARTYWMAIGFELCDEILHDWAHFTSNASTVHPNAVVRRSVLELDPPKQQQFRKLLNPYFSPRAIEKIEVKARHTVNEMIDEFIESGQGDLAQIAWRLPGTILFGEILGLPVEEVPSCLDLISPQMHAETEAARQQAQIIFAAHLTSLLQAKAAQPPGDSLFDMLMRTTDIDGQRLSEEELLWNANLIVAAGLETTGNALTNAYRYLAQHPDQRARLQDDPSLLPAAVEEFIRFEGSVHGLNRHVTEDIEIDGCPLKRGDVLVVNYAAANRDPEAFVDPDNFIMDRQRNVHLGFGAGPHRCLGSNLARMEMSVALEQVFRRLPDYRVDEMNCVYAGNFITRGYTSLPIVFTPGKRR